MGRYCEQERESLETDTSSIHRGKAEHEEAVFALTGAITGALRDEQPAAPSTPD